MSRLFDAEKTRLSFAKRLQIRILWINKGLRRAFCCSASGAKD
jgi:hypothetical protein